jgi:inorganic pyrophosphatase
VNVSVNLWHGVKIGDETPEIVNVIVEIPQRSQNKYEYDKDSNLIKLDRVLFSPLHYPGDYGLIPQTLAEDGDPLDALVLVNNPTYPGVLIEARPIGLLRMIDSGKADDKILCVAKNDPRYSDYNNITDMGEHVLKEIAHFFQVYKYLEGKTVEIIGWLPVDEAHRVVLKSAERYIQRFRQPPVNIGDTME